MAAVWEGRTVVTTEPLGSELTAALLAAGARAVIARRPGQPAVPAEHATAFFQELYQHLLTGRTLVEVWLGCYAPCCFLSAPHCRHWICRCWMVPTKVLRAVNRRHWSWQSGIANHWLVHTIASSMVNDSSSRPASSSIRRTPAKGQ
jgi:hypothetical protein